MLDDSKEIKDVEIEIGPIFVMGAAVYGAHVSPEFAARLRAGVSLLKPRTSQFYICGFSSHDYSEVASIKQFIQKISLVPTNVNLLEESFNTRESIRQIRRMVEGNHFLKPVVVSSSYHKFRILFEAKRQRLNLSFVSAGTSPEVLNRKVNAFRVLLEAIAILYYLLPHPITSRIDTGPGSLRQRLPKKILSKYLGN